MVLGLFLLVLGVYPSVSLVPVAFSLGMVWLRCSLFLSQKYNHKGLIPLTWSRSFFTLPQTFIGQQ